MITNVKRQRYESMVLLLRILRGRECSVSAPPHQAPWLLQRQLPDFLVQLLQHCDLGSSGNAPGQIDQRIEDGISRVLAAAHAQIVRHVTSPKTPGHGVLVCIPATPAALWTQPR